MALRDQPYFPLYVNDFLSDEKLNNCSAEATGVYIRLMCLMHKSQEYGVIELRDRDIDKYKSKANRKQIFEKSQANQDHDQINHVQILSDVMTRFMPYNAEEIERGMKELITEGVVCNDGKRFWQPRMVRDGELSSIRAKAGSAGGKAVRNSPKKKNYNEPGFLYVAEDTNDKDCHKVGITKDLRNRLNGLRRQSQREMQFVFTAEVSDMGTVEDNVLTALNSIRDGEWIYGHPLSEIMKAVNQCVKIANKSKANPENEIEYEYEDENVDPFSKVIAYYQDRFNPIPSGEIIGLLQDYTDVLGGDVVLHVLQYCVAERKFSWSYAKAILQNYKRDGLDSMEKVLQAEQAFQDRKRNATDKDGRRKAKAPGEYKGEDFIDFMRRDGYLNDAEGK